jgi:hypothetical protein
MKLRTGTHGHLLCFLVAGLLVLVTSQSQANTVEVDWTFSGFSTSQITINAGDEVDIINLDYTFDLQVTGAPPESFYADIPPTDGTTVYYVPYVYNNPGAFSFSDEFGNSVTVTVNPLLPLSVAITAPANNVVFTAPATFTVTAVPAGGVTPYAEMDFYVGTNLTGIAYTAPFTNTVTNLFPGNYTISAVVTDNNFNTATNSINVSVSPLLMTNYILPSDCGTIYSSGSIVRFIALTLGSSTEGGLEFPAFNTSRDTAILLELSPSGEPVFDSTVDVYGFDGGTGTLQGSNYNTGTLIGVWTLPPNPGYGQLMTFDITAFVKSVKGPYFGILLYAVGDVFGSTASNYGTPPELYAISPFTPPLAATRAGNQIVLSWPTNYTAGFSLQTSVTLGSGASWGAVSPAAALVGNQWVVTNSISGGSRFYRLSGP